MKRHVYLLYACVSLFSLVLYSQGWYLPEAAHPYYELKDSFDIDFAAPLGPNPPVDALSVKVCSASNIRLPVIAHCLSCTTFPEFHRRRVCSISQR